MLKGMRVNRDKPLIIKAQPVMKKTAATAAQMTIR
jgi:hypothetical protein